MKIYHDIMKEVAISQFEKEYNAQLNALRKSVTHAKAAVVIVSVELAGGMAVVKLVFDLQSMKFACLPSKNEDTLRKWFHAELGIAPYLICGFDFRAFYPLV
jgi:hypothetical protein